MTRLRAFAFGLGVSDSLRHVLDRARPPFERSTRSRRMKAVVVGDEILAFLTVRRGIVHPAPLADPK